MIGVRQSGVNSFRLCPEAYRLDSLDLLPDKTCDATHAGTGLHAGIEAVLRAVRDDPTVEPSVVLTLGMDEMMDYLSLCESNGVPLVKQQSWAAVRRRMELAWTQWSGWMFRQMSNATLGDPLSWEIEMPFRFDADGHTFEGTIDFIANGVIYDWKSGRLPAEWEVRRWAVQPTIYSRAAKEVLGVDSPSFTFVYCGGRQTREEDGSTVLPDAHEFTVTRDQSDWDRLLLELASMEELEKTYGRDRPWPLRTDTWFCSPRWCGNYEECIGKVYTP